MKSFVIIFSLFIFSKSAVAQPDASVPATDRTTTRFCEALMGGFNNGDIAPLLTLLDTNSVVTWQNGDVSQGPIGVKTYYDKMTKGDHATVRKVTSEPKVLGRKVQGDWVISWGELNDHFILNDGRDLPLNSRFTATLAKREDGWKVYAFQASVNAFSNPITAMAVKRISLIAGIGGIITGAIVGLVIASLFRRTKNPN